jgi:parallel beta-helix repeat protein
VKIKRKVFLIKMFIVIFCLGTPLITQAGYDYYVDIEAKETGEGTKDEPFEDIKEAMEELEGKKGEVYIKDGTYKDSFTIPEGIELIGQGRSTVKISGQITMQNNTSLRNLTLIGSSIPITVKGDADVKIKECTISNFGSIGIKVLPGNGDFELSESKITGGIGKGLYLQRGSEIEIVDNVVTNNGEEAIDIREKVEGIIRNNHIEDNGESGIELIVGSSELRIEGNKIKDNGSSGIAFQFYEDFDKKGDILVAGNDVSKNDNYGFDCKKPQGGSSGSSYWKDSIELVNNDIHNNRKSINSSCKLIRAVDEEEEKDNRISGDDPNEDENPEEQKEEDQEGEESQEENTETDENGANSEENAENQEEKELTKEEKQQLEEAKKKEEEARKRQAKEEAMKEIEQILTKSDENLAKVDNFKQEVEQNSSFKLLIAGIDDQRVDELLNQIQASEGELSRANNLLTQIEAPGEEKDPLQTRIDEETTEFQEKKQFLNKQNNSFSLWGFIKNHYVIIISIVVGLILLVLGTYLILNMLKKKQAGKNIKEVKEENKV